MSTIKFTPNTSFEMIIFHYDSNELLKESETPEVIEKLNTGELYVSIFNDEIRDKDSGHTIYGFYLDVDSNDNYEFDEM